VSYKYNYNIFAYNATPLAFYVNENANYDWWIHLGMPRPTVLEGDNILIFVWMLNGFFGTKKSSIFFNELRSRIIHTALMEGYEINAYGWFSKKVFEFDTIFEAKQISSNSWIRPLKQLRIYKEHLNVVKHLCENALDPRVARKLSDDALFDYMRFNTYAFVRANSLNALSREYIEELGFIGNDVLGKTKEPSTIRAKAKAIYNWMLSNYENRGAFYIRKFSDKELKLIKSENAKKMHEIRKAKTKQKILTAIEILKIKGLNISVRKVAAEANVNIATAQKYLKELRDASII
jgi:hypothetical protein